MKMILRHGTLLAIAVLVLLASVSFSESVKLRKPRKRTTTRTPYQQSRIGPVIIRVMHKYTDDGLARGAPGDCINGNCRNAHDKFNLDVNEALSEEDNFLSDEESLRYVVHPEKYEHFVLRKNTGHANRYRRDPSQLHSSNASDHTVINANKVSGNENKMNVTLHRVPVHKSVNLSYRKFKNFSNFSKPFNETARTRRNLPADDSSRYTMINASEVSRNEGKRNFTLHRVPLYRIPLHRPTSFHYTEPTNFSNFSKLLNETARARRNLPADYSSRRNDSDYYAQRKAVMERYYARQREINARYANRTNISRSEHNDVSEHRPTTSNGAVFNFGRIYPKASTLSLARDSATTLPSTKIDPIYANESQYNRVLTELDSRRNVALEIDLGLKSDADLSQTRSSGNIERNALDYFVTPTPCTNLSTSGTLAPKTRSKHARNCTGQSNEDCDHTSIDNVC